MTIYVEEYASSGKSERAFDTNMAERGVLPLLVLVENKGPSSYELKANGATVRGTFPLQALSAEETAARAGRSTVVEALGWSLIVPMITIPAAVAVAAGHTTQVNQRIDADFHRKSLPKGIIDPGKAVSGFLFFELPKHKERSAGLIFEISARNTSSGEVAAVSMTLPDIDYATVHEAANGIQRKSE